MSNKKDSKPDFFMLALGFCMEKYRMRATDIAKITGISSGRISEIINSKYKPGLKVQTRIAEAFNMTLPEFLTLRELMPLIPPQNMRWISSITPLLFRIDEADQEFMEDFMALLIKRRNR